MTYGLRYFGSALQHVWCYVVARVTACASEIRWNIVNTYMLHGTSKFRLMLFLDLCRTFIVRVKRCGGALADVWSEPELFLCLTLKTWDVRCWWIRRIQKAHAEGEWYSWTSDTTYNLLFFLSDFTIMTESSESVQSGQSGVSSVWRFVYIFGIKTCIRLEMYNIYIYIYIM